MSWDTQDTQTAFLLYGPENKEQEETLDLIGDQGKERKKFVPSIFNYFHSICQQKASQLFLSCLRFPRTITSIHLPSYEFEYR